MSPRDLRAIIANEVYDISSESALQCGIESRLVEFGVSFKREVHLSPGDRIDFTVGGIGVEVKTGGSRAALIRQLMRYAKHDDVTDILVVTTVMSLARLPDSLNGRRIHTLVLDTCLF